MQTLKTKLKKLFYFRSYENLLIAFLRFFLIRPFFFLVKNWKKPFQAETYENLLVGLMKFFMKRNPVYIAFFISSLFKKKSAKDNLASFNFRHPFLSASSSFLFCLLILGGVSYFLISHYAQPISAAWWNDDWHYRKAVTITNSGSEQTDFQVFFTLDTTDTGKFQSACGDIRLTDSSGNILPHWVEENNPGCGDSATKIWTKIPMLASGDSEIYAYYGNPYVADAGNGGDVFDFFEDFSQGSLDSAKWGATGGNYVSGGALTVTTGAVYSKNAVLLTALNYVFEYRVKWSGVAATYSGMEIADASSVQSSNTGKNKLVFFMTAHNSLANSVWIADGATASYNIASGASQYTAVADTYYVDGFSIDSANVRLYHEGSQTNSYSGTWSSPPYFWLGAFVGTAAGSTNIRDMTVDWVRARKYASSVPSALVGSEETGPAPVSYWSFDEGYGTTAHDESGQGNSGVVIGADWQDENMCVSGKCLYFNGTDTDYVYATDAPDFDIGESGFTYTAWIKGTDFSKAYNMFMGHYLPYFNVNSSKKLHMSMTADGSQRSVYGATTLETNKWYFVAATFDESGYMKVFLDGRQDGTAGPYPVATNHNSHQYIGKWYSGDDGTQFTGFIDEVKIYPYARTPDQIKQDYNAGLSGANSKKGIAVSIGEKSSPKWMSDGLVAHWKVEDGWTDDARNIADRSGLGNLGNGYGSEAVKDRLGRAGEAMKLSPNNDSMTLNYKTWIDGQTGSIGQFTQNGSTSENYRVLDKDPWGRKVPVWEARTDIESNADGGWSSSNFAIDPNKMYRFSVWIRRTVLGNGSYYLGTNGLNSSSSNIGVLSRSSGAVNTNPYFRSAGGSEISSSDSWFLAVGHVWPAGSGTGSVHADSGLYNINGNKVVSFPNDFVWQEQNAYAKHRSYLYYSTDTSTRQQWVYPRVDVVDGTEPSIQALVFGVDRYGTDIEAEISEDKESIAFWWDENSTGDWSHIVKSGETYYIDGEPAVPALFPAHINGDNLFVGRTSTTDYVGASVDEIRVYNRELSADEARGLYKYSSGPAAYWKFDEKSTSEAFDSSGNGITLSAVGIGSDEIVPGKYGSAYFYDTWEEKHFVSSEILGVQDEATFEAWIYPKAAPSERATIIKGDDSSYYLSYKSDQSLDAYWYGKTSEGYHNSGAGTVPLGQWSHVSAVWDDAGVELYVNGVLKKSVNSTGAGNLAGGLVVGAEDSGRQFNGYIDEVKIYDYARVPKQIVEDMNAGHPAGGSPVGSQFINVNFDEGSGSTAFNKGTSAVDGSLCNGITRTMDGKIGRSLELDGLNDYVDFFDASLFDYTGEDKTFSFWVYADSDESTGHIISKPWNGAGEYNYQIVWDNNSTIRLSMEGAGSPQTLVYSSALSKETWYHVILTLESLTKTATFYIDGKKDNAGAHTISSWVPENGDTVNHLAVGTVYPYNCSSWAGNTGHAFKGKIDEFRVYNYTMDESQVETEYNQGRSLVMGSSGTDPSTGAPTNAASGEYCVPGDTSTCDPPVGEWKFDEMQGDYAEDSSGNENRGTLTNGPVWSATGKIGSALSFDGNDDYVSPSSSDFYPNCQTGCEDPYTISAWIKTNNHAQEAAIAGRFDSASSGHWYNWGSGLKYINGSIAVMGRYNGDNDLLTYDISDSNWHHVVGITNTSNGKLYVDGGLVATGDLSSGYTYDFCIAAQCNDNYSFAFEGEIDNLRVYNYARTPVQVAWDYNRGKPVGWWKMDEFSGTQVDDWSGNANHGVMTNMDPSTDRVEGKFGKALDFDGGDDYVDLPNDVEYDDQVSAFAWFKSEGSPAGGYHIIFGGSNLEISIPTSGAIRTGIYTSARFVSNHGSGLTDGNWHHIGFTFDGSTKNSYIDGEYVGQQTGITGTLISSFSYRRIGRFGSDPGYYLNGLVDDARIYNYALTAEQIRQVYNGGAVNFQ